MNSFMFRTDQSPDHTLDIITTSNASISDTYRWCINLKAHLVEEKSFLCQYKNITFVTFLSVSGNQEQFRTTLLLGKAEWFHGEKVSVRSQGMEH